MTFTIDAKVIEKARKLNVNLSGIAETVLRSFVYKSDGANKERIYEGYSGLFEIVTPLLDEYQTSLVVGSIGPVDDPSQTVIVLNDKGKLALEDNYGESSYPTELKSIAISDFHPPMQILERLVEALYNANEAQEKRLEELEMARRIILAIQPSILKSRSMPMTKQTGKPGESA